MFRLEIERLCSLEIVKMYETYNVLNIWDGEAVLCSLTNALLLPVASVGTATDVKII